MDNWGNLSIREKSELIKEYVSGGVLDLDQMRNHYNSFSNGGDKSSYTPSESIKNYLKKTEGFRSNWYLDGNGIPTVGYGFTGDYFKNKYPNGMTREEADKEFDRVLSKFVGYVKQYTPNYDSLSQNQRDSLLSYMYNVGPGNYTKKSPKFQQALRDKDWESVAKHMDIGYNDKRNSGLRKRRDYERNLFLSGTSSTANNPDFSQYNYYTAQKERALASPEVPQAGQAPPIGMPNIYYNDLPQYEEQDFSKPLPEFAIGTSYDPLNSYIPSRKERRRMNRVAEADVPSVPTNEEIIGNLFNNLSQYENVFDEGGDTRKFILTPLYWNPELSEETITIPTSVNLGQVSVAPQRSPYHKGDKIEFKNEEQKQYVKEALSNIGTYKIPDEFQPSKAPVDATRIQSPHGFLQNQDAMYKPLMSRIAEVKYLQGNQNINSVLSEYKTEDDIKELQKELYESGYLRGDSFKITAKSKNEIEDLQRTLKDAGYDIGNTGKNKDGVDGVIGKKTIAAWKKYTREHPEEANINSVVDGKIGSKTREAVRAFYQDTLSNKEKVETTESDDPYGLSVQMYRNIPTLQKVSSLVGTTIPSHVGAFANKAELSHIGKREGIEDYDAFVADEIEAASEALSEAKKSGNEAKIAEAKERVNVAREKLKTNRLNRSRLSNAEKKAAMAILTGINGGRQMTYDDYMSNLNLIGGDDGNYLGSNPRHKHKKSGKDVMLYDGRSGYHVMNEAENSRGGIEDKEANDSWLRNVIDAEKRIYEDPNRGRLGAFSYYVDSNGDIHIYDRLEATEKKAARGTNDKANYNAARDFFPRSSTSEMRDIITAEEYKNYIEKVLRKEKRKSKKE